MVRPHSDSQYFRRRADEERAAAERASDPRARQSHAELADRYAVAATTELKLVDTELGPTLHPEFRILN